MTMLNLAVCALAVLLGALLWVCVASGPRGNGLTRKIVFENLDSAYAGGQFEPDGYWTERPLSANDIAEDLVVYAEDCGNLDPSYLEPYVREWLRYKGLS